MPAITKLKYSNGTINFTPEVPAYRGDEPFDSSVSSTSNFTPGFQTLSDIEDILDEPDVRKGMEDISAGRSKSWDEIKDTLRP